MDEPKTQETEPFESAIQETANFLLTHVLPKIAYLLDIALPLSSYYQPIDVIYGSSDFIPKPYQLNLKGFNKDQVHQILEGAISLLGPDRFEIAYTGKSEEKKVKIFAELDKATLLQQTNDAEGFCGYNLNIDNCLVQLRSVTQEARE